MNVNKAVISIVIKSYRIFSLDGVKGDFIALEPDNSKDIADPEADVALFYGERKNKDDRIICVWKNVKYFYFSTTNNQHTVTILISTRPIQDGIKIDSLAELSLNASL